MKIVLPERVIIITGWLFAFFSIVPFLIHGQDTPVLIHDNLDSSIAWIKVLLDNKAVFKSPDYLIEQIFNGVPRSGLYAFYDISILCFDFFGMYWGYVCCKFIMAVVAFSGMYFLLSQFILRSEEQRIICAILAILFSLLPFWSFNLTVAGLPAVLYAFLCIRSGTNNIISWIIIIVFPFYSSLILSGCFFMVLILAIMVHDYFRYRKINLKMFSAWLVLGVLYLISHYPVAYMFLYSPYISHRYEIVKFPIPLRTVIREIAEIISIGHSQSASLHILFIPVALAGLYVQYKRKKYNKLFIILCVAILLTSAFYGFYRWEKFDRIFNTLMAILPIQLDRFHFLLPLLWFLLLAVSLKLLQQYMPGKFKYILPGFFLLNLGWISANHEVIRNRKGISFSCFYAETQFTAIRQYLKNEPSSYRVINVGIHPAIAQFNGFYTLDGYLADYPLTYKHEFRNIIARELNKSEMLKYYYDYWGSRCYAFTSELGKKYLYQKHSSPKIATPEFNYEKLKLMGGKYIFSAVEISSPDPQSIRLIQKFVDDNSAWDIYVYEII